MRDLRMKRRREGVPPMEHRGKRKLLRFVFGRTMILVIMLLLPLLVLVASARWLQDYRGVFNFAMTVFGVLAIIWVVNERAEPSFRIMWLVIIAAVILLIRMSEGDAFAWVPLTMSSLSCVEPIHIVVCGDTSALCNFYWQ